MHPDQLYAVRQLRHRDLQMEAEQARAQRELVGNRTSWVSARFAAWFRHWNTHHSRDITLHDRAG